uniref:Uncharacterized protein n=1 Tax=Rhabditophanes sp. KR3021 TaxID=114890 RepID=A0AC35UBY2_9BILA
MPDSSSHNHRPLYRQPRISSPHPTSPPPPTSLHPAISVHLMRKLTPFGQNDLDSFVGWLNTKQTIVKGHSLGEDSRLSSNRSESSHQYNGKRYSDESLRITPHHQPLPQAMYGAGLGESRRPSQSLGPPKNRRIRQGAANFAALSKKNSLQSGSEKGADRKKSLANFGGKSKRSTLAKGPNLL